MSDTPAKRNVYYADPAKFDLSKMRAEASLRARGDQLNAPTTTVIHFHGSLSTCHMATQPDVDHEVYPAIFGEEK